MIRSLPDLRLLGLDTAPIIYFIEDHPDYAPQLTPIFTRIADGSLVGLTSTITLCEVLIHPLRLSQPILASQYRELLLESQSFRCLPIDPATAELGAHLRATYHLRTPDALQLACAILAGCEAFLTNDRGLTRVRELPVWCVEDLPMES